jgi:NAD(P)-dependent dehydrogenase (short-subunit alcohol dehydrogenase family)
MESKKVALITGAAGALGSAVAETFNNAGYRLSLLDKNIESMQQKWQGKENVTCLPCDLTDAESIEEAVDNTLTSYGSIDVLLTIAGGFAMGPQVHELTEDDWDSMQNMNLRTVFLVSRAVIPHMRKRQRGSIVTIGAQTALHGAANLAPYVVSKSSVIRLTECMAEENKTEGIRINCILPSVIDTPANRADMPDADFTKWTKPEAIADVLLFLASDASKAINGASIPV